jgi:glycine/D-amino acid oxidase-like deaminating enzyme
MRNGIHLLVSQHEDGLLTIGDSHHYGLHVDPFMSQEIEDLMLSYLDTFLPVENLDVVERWYGVYSKHPEKPYFMEDPLPQVHLLTGVGGAGMTLSFGISERHIGEVNKAIGIS